MIKLLFKKQNVAFIITIENKRILYWDRYQSSLWGGPLQYLPPDPSIIKKIQMSRNRIPGQVVDMLRIPKDELEEFMNAKDDHELRDLVFRDCKKNGCLLLEETK